MLFLDSPYSFVYKLTIMILAGVVQSSTGNTVSKNESPASSRFFVVNVQKWLCALCLHFLPKRCICCKTNSTAGNGVTQSFKHDPFYFWITSAICSRLSGLCLKKILLRNQSQKHTYWKNFGF